MKTIYALLFAAVLLAACSDEKDIVALPEPDPTSYNVKFVIKCDSCEGWVDVEDTAISYEVLGYFEFDTTLLGIGQKVSSIAIDYEPKNSYYNTELYIDGVLVSDSTILGDSTISFLAIWCNYILN